MLSRQSPRFLTLSYLTLGMGSRLRGNDVFKLTITFVLPVQPRNATGVSCVRARGR
jgi:hypothetical protein